MEGSIRANMEGCQLSLVFPKMLHGLSKLKYIYIIRSKNVTTDAQLASIHDSNTLGNPDG